MPRFVLLDHDHPAPHLDLMLEAGTGLRTWRLAAPPDAGRAVAAEPLVDHRAAYLEYEGPVSGGRGRVVRVDAGTFAWRHDGPDRVAVRLDGTVYRGDATLEPTPDGWRLTWVPVTG